MPDELCRSCGSSIVNYSLCSQCRKPIQRICINCGNNTLTQFHNDCFYHIESVQKAKGLGLGTTIIPTHSSHKRGSSQTQIQVNTRLRNSILILSIVGLFVVGFVTLDHLDLYANQTGTALATSQSAGGKVSTFSNIAYKNCLAYGSGESMTVTCPTKKGTVYETILGLPQNLAAKFSNTPFSIRNLSLEEHSNGSVVIKYGKNLYYSRFF